MAEGRALFLLGLRYRYLHAWDDARHCFEKAVAQNDPDACFHLFVQKFFDDDMLSDDDEVAALRLLEKGAALGHAICVDLRQVHQHYPHFQLAPPLEQCALNTAVFLRLLSADASLRDFTATEIEQLRKAAEDALLIHDPWPVRVYFSYAAHKQPDLFRTWSPYLMGHALFLLQDNIFEYVWESRTLTGYTPCGFISNNRGGLSSAAQRVARCVMGQLTMRLGIHAAEVPRICTDVYLACKQNARKAAIAWMGVFCRCALPYMSRDTATLVAKLIACPIRWASSDVREERLVLKLTFKREKVDEENVLSL